MNWVSTCGDRDLTEIDRITTFSTFDKEMPSGVHGGVISLPCKIATKSRFVAVIRRCYTPSR